ncbi:hypothetical protein BDN70DRAFT_610341 [Pholiota conissans]|uniref:Uncharacterized protein n=1 Tax=Pholiota conissans TaxID=109636 RepID=A0A9P5YLG1_9AGAR|nr:hypothetical protein BDN70DRAFT_610341 [Pholiota conissans]
MSARFTTRTSHPVSSTVSVHSTMLCSCAPPSTTRCLRTHTFFPLSLDLSISSEVLLFPSRAPSYPMGVIVSAPTPHFAKCHSTPSLSLVCLVFYARAHSQRHHLSFVPALIATTHFD